jgi:hypothetical protein
MVILKVSTETRSRVGLTLASKKNQSTEHEGAAKFTLPAFIKRKKHMLGACLGGFGSKHVT